MVLVVFFKKLRKNSAKVIEANDFFTTEMPLEQARKIKGNLTSSVLPFIFNEQYPIYFEWCSFTTNSTIPSVNTGGFVF